MADESVKTETVAASEPPPAAAPPSPPVDEYADVPDTEREYVRNADGELKKMDARTRAYVLQLARERAEELRNKQEKPVEQAKQAAAEVEPDDKVSALEKKIDAMLQAQQAREQREEASRQQAEFYRNLDAALDRHDELKDDDARELVREAVGFNFLLTKRQISEIVREKVEKLSARDKKRNEGYIRAKTADASRTRGETAGARSPAKTEYSWKKNDLDTGEVARQVKKELFGA